jgi:class 3 adenylate cyclase/pimeloyl-ACP methyl ester carboxylesterase
MIPSEIRYAKSGTVHVAYQSIGDGPVDMILGFSGISQLGVMWEEPGLVEYYRAVSEFARLVLFDKRGVGLSDRNVGIATLEERMDDIRAVMEAIGSRRAVLLGTLDGTPLSLLFAASYPEKTLALILWGGQARSLWAPDYPWAKTRADWESEIRRDEDEWGSQAHIDRMVAQLAPSRVGDPAFHRWMSRRIRYGASPAEGSALSRMNMQIDVRTALSALHVPTLVLYTRASRASSPEDAKFLADNIPGAKLEEVECPDHLFWATPQGLRAVVGPMRRFVEGLEEGSETDRILTTVLFTDMVSSTKRASEVGDRRWARLLERNFEFARREVARYRGNLIKTTGDGVLAIFDGPTRAIRCALGLRDEAQAEGLSIRAGLHTGECVHKGDDVHGIAVNIASRIADSAGADEVLISGTVRDLSFGCDIPIQPRGSRVLKGVDGEWRIYAAGVNSPPESGAAR